MLSALRRHLAFVIEDSRPEEELRRAVVDFLDDQRQVQYMVLRPRLLEFCLSEGISPEALAYLVADQPANRFSADEYLTPLVMGDWPLRYVCLAHRMFWEAGE
jgi:hypothetical protein